MSGTLILGGPSMSVCQTYPHTSCAYRWLWTRQALDSLESQDPLDSRVLRSVWVGLDTTPYMVVLGPHWTCFPYRGSLAVKATEAPKATE